MTNTDTLAPLASVTLANATRSERVAIHTIVPGQVIVDPYSIGNRAYRVIAVTRDDAHRGDWRFTLEVEPAPGIAGGTFAMWYQFDTVTVVS